MSRRQIQHLAVAFPAAIMAALVTTPALAHHFTGGEMHTFMQGLLSGLGHPILGFDHLFFICAMGAAAAYTGRALTAPLGFLAGMVGGCVLIMAGIPLPAVEFVIAASLVIAGGVLVSGRALGFVPAIVLFGIIGLFHGWAFGMVIVGQEAGMGASVVAGYLIGLATIQWVVAVGAGWIITRIASSAEAIQPRVAGAAVAGVGAFLVLEVVEGVVFTALGA